MPFHPDQFSTGWLEGALKAPRGSLETFSATAIGTGQMSHSFRVRLNWRGHDGPASVVAKCSSSDAGTRAVAKSLRNYTLELGWYRELAAHSIVACPACFFIESTEDNTEFVLLLQDLAPASQGDQIAGASVEQMRAALVQAARLHAPYWNKPELGEIAWLQAKPEVESAVRQMIAPLYVKFRERYADRLSAEVIALADAFIAKVANYFGHTAASRTIQHRDMRLDNLLFTPDQRRAHVVDWQTLGTGPGATDVAYLLGTSIADPSLRAGHERELIEGYVGELRSLGVDADFDEVWKEYRFYAFSGLVMAIIASMNVVRTARGDEMFAVMAERSALQALHLRSLDLLD